MRVGGRLPSHPQRRQPENSKTVKLSKKLSSLLATAALGSLVVALVGAPYSGWYQDWRDAQCSLETLLKEQAGHQNDPIFLYYIGRRLNERQRYAEAAPFLECAVGLDPESARQRDEWARALLGSGEISSAFGQLKQFAGTHPASADAHLLMAKYYLTQDAAGPARDELQRVVALDPNRAEAWTLLANARLKLGENSAGVEALRHSLRLRPDNAIDRLQLAAALALMNSHDAQQEYQRALLLAPTNAFYHREYAMFLYNGGRAAEAEVEARRAVALQRDDALAHLILGRCLLLKGRNVQALEPLTQASRLAPFEPAPAQELRRAYSALGRTQEARHWKEIYLALQRSSAERRHVKDQLSIDRNRPETNREMARLLAQTGDVQGAMRYTSIALRCRLDAPQALIAVAEDLTRSGFARLALGLARQAKASAPLNPAASESLGDVLLNLDRVHEAAVLYDEAAQYSPDRASTYRRKIAEYLARRRRNPSPAEKFYQRALARMRASGRPDDAVLALVRQAVAQEPENTGYLRCLLQLQIRRRARAQALQTADRLLALSPEDGIAHALAALLLLDEAHNELDFARIEDHLRLAEPDSAAQATSAYAGGLLAVRRGQTQVAVRELRQAAQLDPNSSQVWLQLARIERQAGHNMEASAAQQAYQRLHQ